MIQLDLFATADPTESGMVCMREGGGWWAYYEGGKAAFQGTFDELMTWTTAKMEKDLGRPLDAYEGRHAETDEERNEMMLSRFVRRWTRRERRRQWLS